jgi:hypothetical protein
VTVDEASAALNFDAPAPGVLIPYFDRDGNVIDFCRIRFDDYKLPGFAAQSLEKPMRYAQLKAKRHSCLLSPVARLAKGRR